MEDIPGECVFPKTVNVALWRRRQLTVIHARRNPVRCPAFQDISVNDAWKNRLVTESITAKGAIVIDKFAVRTDIHPIFRICSFRKGGNGDVDRYPDSHVGHCLRRYIANDALPAGIATRAAGWYGLIMTA
jgi:hypothetical protein